jgi:hypothetical protein
MNSPPTQMIGHDLSTIEWPTLLFDRFRYTFNLATETGRICDALEAISVAPVAARRSAGSEQTRFLPTPRRLQDILDREGRPL